MKRHSEPRFAIIKPRQLLPLLLSASLLVTLPRSGALAASDVKDSQLNYENNGIQWGRSYRNDVSPALRDLPQLLLSRPPSDEPSHEANPNPKLPIPLHVDEPDQVVDQSFLGILIPDAMPATILNFDGIPYPGVACNCHPPDTNGVVGATQYVQMVNEGYQVFNKTTGAS